MTNAEATIRFAILDAIASTYGPMCHIDDVDGLVDAIFKSMFRQDVIWSVETFLQEKQPKGR